LRTPSSARHTPQNCSPWPPTRPPVPERSTLARPLGHTRNIDRSHPKYRHISTKIKTSVWRFRRYHGGIAKRFELMILRWSSGLRQKPFAPPLSSGISPCLARPNFAPPPSPEIWSFSYHSCFAVSLVGACQCPCVGVQRRCHPGRRVVISDVICAATYHLRRGVAGFGQVAAAVACGLV